MDIAHRFFSHWPNWIGLLIIWTFVEVALFAPWLAPLVPSTDPNDPGLNEIRILPGRIRIPQAPNADAVLGTTDAREDVFYALVWGTRAVLTFSLKAVLISGFVGVTLGAFSGWVEGWPGSTMMRVTDGFLTIPVIAGVVILEEVRNVLLSSVADVDTLMLAVRGVGPIPAEAANLLAFDTLLWAIILLGWMPYARMTNALVLRIKANDFVQAARALGASGREIMSRHLIPNVISPSIIMITRDMGWVVILQASMAFAGFGGTSHWGTLLLQQRKWIIGAGGNPFGYWWVWLPITVALVLYGTGWSLLGDGLNDALNPRDHA
jgi:peptide/nickel transport system permease protein